MSAEPQRPDGVLTRRHFLRLAGGAAILSASGGFLAACTAAASPSPTISTATSSPLLSASPPSSLPSPTPTTTPPLGGTISIFTWDGYEGADVLKDWYAKNNLTLQSKPVTNENIGAFLKSPAGQGFDASTMSQSDYLYYPKLGVAAQLTVDEVPALGTMLSFFDTAPFWKISDGIYNSAPWTWGPIGINTRPDRVPSPINSWQDLLDPKFKGRLGTYDDGVNMVSVGAVATGADPAKLTVAQLNGQVKDYLTKLQPQLKVLSTSLGDQLNTLVSGDVDVELVGLAWFVAEAKKQNTTIDFQVPPKEGSYGFVDAAIVTPWAKNRAAAIAYVNALMQGDTAVAMANSLNQLSCNPDVNAKVDPNLRSLFPTDLNGYLNNQLKWNVSWSDPASGYATVTQWQDLWNEIKALG